MRIFMNTLAACVLTGQAWAAPEISLMDVYKIDPGIIDMKRVETAYGRTVPTPCFSFYISVPRAIVKHRRKTQKVINKETHALRIFNVPIPKEQVEEFMAVSNHSEEKRRSDEKLGELLRDAIDSFLKKELYKAKIAAIYNDDWPIIPTICANYGYAEFPKFARRRLVSHIHPNTWYFKKEDADVTAPNPQTSTTKSDKDESEPPKQWAYNDFFYLRIFEAIEHMSSIQSIKPETTEQTANKETSSAADSASKDAQAAANPKPSPAPCLDISRLGGIVSSKISLYEEKHLLHRDMIRQYDMLGFEVAIKQRIFSGVVKTNYIDVLPHSCHTQIIDACVHTMLKSFSKRYYNGEVATLKVYEVFYTLMEADKGLVDYLYKSLYNTFSVLRSQNPAFKNVQFEVCHPAMRSKDGIAFPTWSDYIVAHMISGRIGKHPVFHISTDTFDRSYDTPSNQPGMTLIWERLATDAVNHKSLLYVTYSTFDMATKAFKSQVDLGIVFYTDEDDTILVSRMLAHIFSGYLQVYPQVTKTAGIELKWPCAHLETLAPTIFQMRAMSATKDILQHLSKITTEEYDQAMDTFFAVHTMIPEISRARVRDIIDFRRYLGGPIKFDVQSIKKYYAPGSHVKAQPGSSLVMPYLGHPPAPLAGKPSISFLKAVELPETITSSSVYLPDGVGDYAGTLSYFSHNHVIARRKALQQQAQR